MLVEPVLEGVMARGLYNSLEVMIVLLALLMLMMLG